MTYCLGKKSAQPPSPKTLRFAKYAVALPMPPATFGYDSLLPKNSGILGNDQWGDCVLAGAGHETMLWNSFGGNPVVFNTADTLADYSAITGFDPHDPSTDQGTDMMVAAAYRRNTGIRDDTGLRHKVGAYVSLDRGNWVQHKLACWLFGAVGIGIIVSRTQLDQFDRGEPWDGPLDTATAGGHYVPLVGYDRDGYLLVVTWGRIQKMTLNYFLAQNDESVAYLSEEFLKAGVNPPGFNLAQLQTDLNAINSAKGILPMPATPVDPKTLAAQIAAGNEASAAMIKAKVPGWEQMMIPAGAIAAVVEAVVVAANSVRDNPLAP